MKLLAVIITAAAAIAGVAAGSMTIKSFNEKGPAAESTQQTAEAVQPSGSFAHNMDMLMPRDKNYMFSPFSIKAALALAANGADGETLKEIENVLQCSDIGSLNGELQALTKRYENLENTEISIADSIWLNTDVADGTSFNKNYAAKVLELFGAEPRNVTNQNAVETLNSWCSEKTKGKIDKIIDDPEFMAALVNAVYFNGKWEYQFNKDATQKSPFTVRNGKNSEIDFMNNTHKYNFYKDKDIKMLELPYSDGKLAMYAYLTDDKRVDITDYFDKLSETEVKVSIPKFKTEYSRELSNDLQTLGMGRVFNGSLADFRKMFEDYSDDTSFYIDKVLHKTYIDVDEEGTEAAAVTAVMMQNLTTSVDEKPKPEEFIADKPFGYCIADRETHEILFMGEYAFAE